MAAFEVWADYFRLAQLVQAMADKKEEAAAAAALAALQLRDDGEEEAPAPPRPRRPVEASPEAAVCQFCKHNGETRRVYASHQLKDDFGRVQCPVLRNYTCPQCGASGDLAHTKRFCPLTRRGYASVYSRSGRNSAGKRWAWEETVAHAASLGNPRLPTAVGCPTAHP